MTHSHFEMGRARAMLFIECPPTAQAPDGYVQIWWWDPAERLDLTAAEEIPHDLIDADRYFHERRTSYSVAIKGVARGIVATDFETAMRAAREQWNTERRPAGLPRDFDMSEGRTYRPVALTPIPENEIDAW